MKYSVIIPAYNCEKTIEITVNSILNSGLSDFEIIIVNDGSKDDTEYVCDKLAKEHPEIVCVNKENSGVSSTRNRGIDEAKGEYLLFMDADDTVDADSLKEPCEKISENNPDMLIFGLSFDYLNGDKTYRRDELVYPDEGLFTPEKWGGIFLDLFNHNSLSPVWNKIYKAEIIKKNNICFNNNVFLMEDFLFVLDCLKETETIYLCNKVIYRYYQPEDDTRIYSRLNRVTDINSYIEPFSRSTACLTAKLKEKYNFSFSQGEEVLFLVYSMIINQKAYYADVDNLKKLSQTIKTGEFSDYKTTDVLICDLKNENYKEIIKRNKKTQIRHKIALKVKKNAIYQKLRGN